ncbi:hypothetical protein ACTFQF_00500 [Aliivibrio fischeri]|uniref:Uncharacterized protein n=1 Tax=Aliivibrio fischeri (strain MJ11) TaxID=388396 RepID=B5EVV9_ALIFM|nr:hypothetical protein [Aliivibrio fischeri]ACH64794.1 hypothetical protein VFMJ11_B0016 [Aliivibrio fischeri MJ11]MUK37535.1 hypothetical protein [Aliivibrio fischeri]
MNIPNNYQFSFNSNNAEKKIKKMFGSFPSTAHYAIKDNDDKNKVEQWGEWTLKSFPDTNHAGYFSTNSGLGVGVSLLKNGTPVMSQTPLELESHLMAQHSARGRVVVAGIGLAMIILSLLKKKEVTNLIALEIDSEIISMYPHILSGESKKLWESNIKSGRLKIIKVDCKSKFNNDILNEIGIVDYLWADIWNDLGSIEALGITQHLAEQLKPKQCDYWGVEIFIAIMSLKKGEFMCLKTFKEVAKSLKLPLSVLEMDGKKLKMYAELALVSAKNIYIQERARNNKTQPLHVTL